MSFSFWSRPTVARISVSYRRIGDLPGRGRTHTGRVASPSAGAEVCIRQQTGRRPFPRLCVTTNVFTTHDGETALLDMNRAVHFRAVQSSRFHFSVSMFCCRLLFFFFFSFFLSPPVRPVSPTFVFLFFLHLIVKRRLHPNLTEERRRNRNTLTGSYRQSTNTASC